MLGYSYLEDPVKQDTEPVGKMFELPGDDRPKPRDLGCPYRRPMMKPHWGTELPQTVGAIGEGYPVRSAALGPTRMCDDLSTAGLRSLNPVRWANDTCEAWCGTDVCREYGNQLEAYFDCLRCGREGCKRPQNPRDCGCRLAGAGGAQFKGCYTCLHRRQ